MVNLVRNKRKFYLCKKIANSTKFEKPIPKNLNYQPVNSVGEMLTLGEEYSMYLKIKCSPTEAADFSDKDRCYIYKQPANSPDNTWTLTLNRGGYFLLQDSCV